jgi:hypothetical protein
MDLSTQHDIFKYINTQQRLHLANLQWFYLVDLQSCQEGQQEGNPPARETAALL